MLAVIDQHAAHERIRLELLTEGTFSFEFAEVPSVTLSFASKVLYSEDLICMS